jgi:hypothetical protein
MFVQPNGPGIPGDEFVDGHAINYRRPWNPLPPAVHEDRHELLFAVMPRRLFSTGSLALPFGHLRLFGPLWKRFPTSIRTFPFGPARNPFIGGGSGRKQCALQNTRLAGAPQSRAGGGTL